MSDETTKNLADIDPAETQEWLDAIATVINEEGTERARFLLKKIIEQARRSGADVPYGLNTPYVNIVLGFCIK